MSTLGVTHDLYFPPSESRGGWRWLRAADEVAGQGGMDLARLEEVGDQQGALHGGHSWGIAIIRHGWLVREFYSFNVLVSKSFDIWSCTKSFTGTAWGLLLEESQQGTLGALRRVELDSPAYSLIPEGHPLTDSRKERITIRHLLTMTSGIAGEASGVRGMPQPTWGGPYEHALGRSPNRFGKWVDKLVAEPGSHWEYSDPAIAHLALAFAYVMGQEAADYLRKRVLDVIGIENLSWDIQGGSGFLGPHTNSHTGVHISARELARLGYLMLHRGRWGDQQVLPEWWVDLATHTSQDHNPSYGYTWWVNTRDTRWPGIPRDAFAAEGYRCNRCYVIPSLDLVVSRVATGPASPLPVGDPSDAWDELGFLRGVVAAVI